MKLTKLYAILLGLMLLAACSKTGEVASSSSAGDEPLPPVPPVPEVRYDSQFSVWSDATPMGTKLYFDTEDGNALKWTADDHILLCNQSGTWKSYYVKDGGDTHAWLYFDEGTADLSGTSFYAVYPYPGNICPYQDGVYSLVIPTTQTYTAGGFDPAAFPMVGTCGEVKALQFKNAGAVLAVRPMSGLSSSSKITAITLSANEALAGECSVTWDGSGDPSVSCTESTSVTLNCGDGIDWGTTAYICVAPGTYSDFCVDVTYTNATTASSHYTWHSNLTVNRSTIKKIPVDFTDVVDYKDLTTIAPVQRTALATPQTANCYLITDNTAQYYRFPITVKGNGVPTDYCDDNDYSTKISPKDVKALYVYYRTGLGACSSTIFSEEPELIGDYICFKTMAIAAGSKSNPPSVNGATATDAGTALISISSNPSWTSGEGMQALWSWCIWYNPVVNDHYLPGNTARKWLNINIGANQTAYPASPIYSGYYYQWGRKDPLQPADAALANPFVDKSSTQGSLALSVANPASLYGKDATGLYDWAAQEPCYYDWWNANQTAAGQTGIAVAKTMWDPCPPGYRVMSYEAVQALLAESTQKASVSSLGFGNGWSLTFPGMGSRRPTVTSYQTYVHYYCALGGISSSKPIGVCLWGATAKNSDETPKTAPTSTSFIRSYATPIRCEKE